MDDPISMLRERLAKAESKAVRAEKTWEAAKNEVNDLSTALRVMLELSGGESPGSGPAAGTADRQRLIVNLLKVGDQAAQSPAELFEAYRPHEEISIDTFRTTIWRMRDKAVGVGEDLWLVKGVNGQYWKEPGTSGTRHRYEQAILDEMILNDVRGDLDPFEDTDPPF